MTLSSYSDNKSSRSRNGALADAAAQQMKSMARIRQVQQATQPGFAMLSSWRLQSAERLQHKEETCQILSHGSRYPDLTQARCRASTARPSTGRSMPTTR